MHDCHQCMILTKFLQGFFTFDTQKLPQKNARQLTCSVTCEEENRMSLTC